MTYQTSSALALMTPAATTALTAPTVTASSVVRELNRLSKDSTKWEATAYKKSTDALYAILTRCYAIYATMSGDTAEAKEAKAGLEKYCQRHNLKFKRSTHALAKIVACVFRTERRRVSAYSIALQRAWADAVAVTDLAAYIENAGGVEELRLNKRSAPANRTNKAAVAASDVRSSSLGSLSVNAATAKFNANRIDKQVVLIGTVKADGTIEVNAVVDNEATLNTALNAYYKQRKTELALKQAEDAQAVKTEQLEKAVAQAVVETRAQQVRNADQIEEVAA